MDNREERAGANRRTTGWEGGRGGKQTANSVGGRGWGQTDNGLSAKGTREEKQRGEKYARETAEKHAISYSA